MSEYVPGARLSCPLLQFPALTQIVADPPLMVTVEPVAETVTPFTVSEPPGPTDSIPPVQLPSTPGNTARAGLGKIAHAIMSSVPAVTTMRPATESRRPSECVRDPSIPLPPIVLLAGQRGTPVSDA
jgi:hypothetical protein